jgi:hypothetical protein
MPVHIVMDQTGDSRHAFRADDAAALAEAEAQFLRLTGSGFTAAARTASGELEKVATFDPAREETLFFPRLIGG